MARRECAARQVGARRRRHPRQDHDHRAARLDPGTCRTRRRVFSSAAWRSGLRGLGAGTHRQRVLRHRSRRIRHRAFFDKRSKFVHYRRAHRDPQQPRIRPRRHLSRSRGDRDTVLPPRAHDSAQRDGSSSMAARTVLRRVLARGCWSEVERFGLAAVADTGAGLDDWQSMERFKLGGAPQGTCLRRSRCSRPPQSAQCAGCDRGGAARGRAGRCTELCRARGVPRHQASSRVARRRASTASPSTTTSRTIRPPSRPRWTDCAARWAARGFSRFSSRARTR